MTRRIRRTAPASHRACSARHCRRAGFTLLELLVVLMLFAITAAAAVPAFLGERANGAERDAATQVAMALTRVRDGARASGSTASLVIAPTDGRMWLVWRDSTVVERITLAPGVQLAAHEAERVECRFAPAGTATPFVITIQGRQRIAVRVDGWSGEITIGDGTPT